MLPIDPSGVNINKVWERVTNPVLWLFRGRVSKIFDEQSYKKVHPEGLGLILTYDPITKNRDYMLESLSTLCLLMF